MIFTCFAGCGWLRLPADADRPGTNRVQIELPDGWQFAPTTMVLDSNDGFDLATHSMLTNCFR
jgi:hypothetical protein